MPSPAMGAIESQRMTPQEHALLIAQLHKRIKHIFVIFQENHSYDNYFGTFSNSENIGTALAQSHGYTQWDHVAHRMQTVFKITNPTVLGPDQDRYILENKFNGGKMNEFLTGEEADNIKNYGAKPGAARQYGLTTMAIYDCDTIPYLWMYANNFTLFDHYFQSETGPSSPGNVAMFAAQAGISQEARFPQEASTKAEGHWFGGVPLHVLCDNPKTIVIERDAYADGRHKYNGKVLDFAKHCGFNIKLCASYRAHAASVLPAAAVAQVELEGRSAEARPQRLTLNAKLAKRLKIAEGTRQTPARDRIGQRAQRTPPLHALAVSFREPYRDGNDRQAEDDVGRQPRRSGGVKVGAEDTARANDEQRKPHQRREQQRAEHRANAQDAQLLHALLHGRNRLAVIDRAQHRQLSRHSDDDTYGVRIQHDRGNKKLHLSRSIGGERADQNNGRHIGEHLEEYFAAQPGQWIAVMLHVFLHDDYVVPACEISRRRRCLTRAIFVPTLLSEMPRISAISL